MDYYPAMKDEMLIYATPIKEGTDLCYNADEFWKQGTKSHMLLLTP